MPSVLNLAAYKFVSLDDEPGALEALRERVLALAGQHDLKGTVLLAPEGINLFLAGTPDSARSFLQGLKKDERFADLEAKESWCSESPFQRLLVKVKREIIRMNHPAVRPQSGRAPAVSSDTLVRWLDKGVDDDGRPVLMLDTRNAFEVRLGRFAGAIDWNIDKFSEFPDALRAHANDLADKTVVTYCTGGIRCEKAALLMQAVGLENVLQLDGGILKFLESQGGAPGGRHYEGECFVFDERRTLDSTLRAQGLPPEALEAVHVAADSPAPAYPASACKLLDTPT